MGVCVYTPTAFTILITTIYTHTTITSCVCVCVYIQCSALQKYSNPSYFFQVLLLLQPYVKLL